MSASPEILAPLATLPAQIARQDEALALRLRKLFNLKPVISHPAPKAERSSDYDRSHYERLASTE
jgi:hypothetical protein